MLVSGFHPQGDMGATGPVGAPGPKGEKGDSVSKEPSVAGAGTRAFLGRTCQLGWPECQHHAPPAPGMKSKPVPMGTGGLLAAPAASSPHPPESGAPAWL